MKRLPSLAILKSVLLMVMVLISGCSTLYGKNDRHINITSEPPGAELYMDGVQYSKTPAIILMPYVGAGALKLTLKKQGFKDQTVFIETDFQNVGWYNIIIPLGFLIDLGAGYMFKIDPNYTNLNIQLESNVKNINMNESYIKNMYIIESSMPGSIMIPTESK